MAGGALIGSAAPASAAYAPVVLGDNPAGYWRLGESSSAQPLNDETANNNDGIYLGGPTLGVPGALSGDPNTAVRFDGVDDLGRVPDSASLDVGDTFTAEGWIKRSSTTKAHQIMTKGDLGLQLIVMTAANANQVWLRKTNVSTIARSTAGVPADGKYHHIVATKSGVNSTKIYIDGTGAGTVQVSGSQIVQNTSFPLQFSGVAGNEHKLDELALYNRVLSAAEVLEHHQAGQDQPPVAVADNPPVGEDSGANVIAVLANDTDIDGGPKTISSATDPAHGTVVLTGGSPGAHTGLTYTPDANYCNNPPGSPLDTFSYTLNGGSTATVSVTVNCVDDPPVAVADSPPAVLEDAAATNVPVLTNDTDVDGGSKTIASATDPANGTVVLTGGSPGAHTGLTYQPDANYCNTQSGGVPDTFTYSLNPGGSTATVSMTVTCVTDPPVVSAADTALVYTENDPPTKIDPTLTITADAGSSITGATVQITANYSSSQDVLALSGVHPGISAIYSFATGTLTLTGTATPAAYQAALRDVTYANTSEAPSTSIRTVTFTVTDNAVQSASDSRDIQVTSVDDSPVAVNDSPPAVLEDAAATNVPVLTNDTDVDGGSKTIASATDPAHGTVVLTGGSPGAHTGLTYQPDPGYCNDPPGNAPDTFSYSLNPGGFSATVSMTVTCVAGPPVVNAANTALFYTENDPPTKIDPNLTITADAGSSITGATVAITTNFVGGQDVLALAGLHAGIAAVPQIGNTLTLTGTATPAAYQAALRDVTYVNTSEGPSTSTRTVTFTVTDDAAQSGSDTRDIQVSAVNDPPTAADDTGATDEDTPLIVLAPGVLANDTDIDPSDTKTVVALNGSGTLNGSSAEGGTVAIHADGSYTYTPPSAFQAMSTGQSDTDSFQYTMRDAANAQSSATVNLTVHGVSDAPTAVTDTFDAIGNTGLFVGTTRPADQAGKVITGSILTNDTDPDSPHANLEAEPVTNAPTSLGGTITIESDGNFTYQPAANVTATTDTFTYRVCDNTPCSSATVANSTGTINLVLGGQVWYVRNNQAAGGDGTSDTPFDTLGEAEAASQTGDTVYVFDGNNTTTNLDTGYVMEANERLIGESRPLSLDVDGPGGDPATPLYPGNAPNVPTLTASNEDVVSLASGVTVDGFSIDPSGTGGGIAGGSGAGGGAAGNVTVARVDVTDTGTSGTQPGIELDGTTGTNAFSEVTVTNGGSATAIGVRLNSAGTVSFAAAGTTSIATTGAKALDAAATNMGTSTFDDIIVPASATGAVRLNNTTGQTTLGDGAGTDLSLQTTSGSTAALEIAMSNSVSVDAGGGDTISATGGPAVDIRNSNGSTFEFDSVSSTSSANDGINLDTNISTPFTATTGSISGAAGIAVDVAGAAGVVSYGGPINDGSGPLSVEVTGRTGGSVTLSGSIGDDGDTGGGISLNANTAGTTTFSGTSKVLSTGSSTAVSSTASSASSALSFTNGGLDIDATSGAGFDANSGGTISVEGTANTIDTTTGRALRIQNSPIADTDVTLRRVSSNGAANGIVLNNTTNALGRLFVTGNGTTCSSAATCDGGAIQNSTGAGVELTSVPGGVSLTRVAVTSGDDDGIRATTVNDIDLADSIVTNNGDLGGGAPEERGLDYLNVTGTPQILRTTVSGSDDSNAHIQNTVAGTTTLNVDASTFSGSKFNAGLRLRGEGPSVMNATVVNSFFALNADPGFAMSTDSANTAHQTLLFSSNEVSGGSSNAVSGRPQVSINVDSASIVKATITNNKIKSAAGHEVILNTLAHHTGTFDVKFNNNSIGDAQPGSLDALADGGTSINGWAHGDGVNRMEIRDNTVQNWGGRALELSLNDGTGDADYTVTGNVLSNPDTPPSGSSAPFEAIYAFSGGATGDAADVCVDMENNDMDGIGRNGYPDIGLDRFTGNVLRFADFNDTSVPNLQNNLRAKNPASTGLTVQTFSFGPTATTDTACDLPVGTP